MARPKRTSPSLEKAELRAAGLRSVDQALSFGNSLSLSVYTTAIDDLRNKLAAYNKLLSSVDETYSELKEAEHSVNDLSERMLTGVATQYGKNSTQYMMAGGVRKSERKPRTRKSSSN